MSLPDYWGNPNNHKGYCLRQTVGMSKEKHATIEPEVLFSFAQWTWKKGSMLLLAIKKGKKG